MFKQVAAIIATIYLVALIGSTFESAQTPTAIEAAMKPTSFWNAQTVKEQAETWSGVGHASVVMNDQQLVISLERSYTDKNDRVGVSQRAIEQALRLYILITHDYSGQLVVRVLNGDGIATCTWTCTPSQIERVYVNKVTPEGVYDGMMVDDNWVIEWVTSCTSNNPANAFIPMNGAP